MEFNLFGLRFGGLKQENEPDPIQPTPISPVDPVQEDGATVVSSSAAGYYGYYVDLDGTIKDEISAIQRYREISLFADVDLAIEDIVNEAIPMEEDSGIVRLDLDKLEYPPQVKEAITVQFNRILRLLDFKTNANEIFRNFYIDGRLYYNLLPSDNPYDGLAEIRPIESTKIKKIVEVIKQKTPQGIDVITGTKEYYVYAAQGFTPNQSTTLPSSYSATSGVRLDSEAVVFVPSGYTDKNTGLVLSYLHKALRPANQLRMIEDSVVIYRLSRAPERRIFYIDVGNLPQAKADQYVRGIMDKYRNKLVFDSKTGEIRDDKKHMCLAMDTKVPLLDGRTLTLSEIAEEHKSGKKLWAYSCNPTTGKFVPGRITWAGETRKNAQVMRLTLDNGKEIVCTPDHKFPVWGKGFVRADKMTEGESLIPHYTKKVAMAGRNHRQYEKIFDPAEKKWVWTHTEVFKWKNSVGMDNSFVFDANNVGTHTVVHHSDFSMTNNNPENLVEMDNLDHFTYHSVVGKNGGKIGGRVTYENGLGMFNKKHAEMYKTEYPESVISCVVECAKLKMTKAETIEFINNSTVIADFIAANAKKVMKSQKNYSKFGRGDIDRCAGLLGTTYSNLVEQHTFRNHKVVKIEYLEERIDTGCLTIDGDEVYHNYHTFALDAGVFTKNSMLEDFWLPRRDGGKGTEVTTLPGGTSLGVIDDVQYFKEKLAAALNLPLSRILPDQPFSIGRPTEISRDELKFQKFIQKLRRKFNQLFVQLLRVQLLMTNTITEEDWEEVKEHLNFVYQRDNFFSEMKNADLLMTRAQTAQALDLFLGKYFSVEWVSRNVFKMSDEEIAKMQAECDAEYAAKPWWFTAQAMFEQQQAMAQAQLQMQADQAAMMQGGPPPEGQQPPPQQKGKGAK